MAISSAESNIAIATTTSDGYLSRTDKIKLDGIVNSRELLTIDRTYYVATTGIDTNSGLTSTAPFLTIQKAVNTVAGLDLGIYTATIQLADGTYTGVVELKTLVGSGSVIIRGNANNKALVLLTVNTAAPDDSALILDNARASDYTIEHLSLSATASGYEAILVNNKGNVLKYKNLNFGSGFRGHIKAVGASVICTGSYSISGSGYIHWWFESGSDLLLNRLNTNIAISGTPNFSFAFMLISSTSSTFVFSFPGYVTFTGGTTGQKYLIRGVSYAQGFQSNVNFLPGTIAGAVSGNSIYE